MIVQVKSLGSKRPLLSDFSVPLPPALPDDDGGQGNFTLRDLIERVVHHEVQAFKKRQSDRQFIRVLTERELDAAVEAGKVEMGASETGVQHVDEQLAVDAALTAFEDGLYLVVIDEIHYEKLDQAVFLSHDSRLTFIRLTMLSGA